MSTLCGREICYCNIIDYDLIDYGIQDYNSHLFVSVAAVAATPAILTLQLLMTIVAAVIWPLSNALVVFRI